jgi:hypothetical protein
MAELGQYADVQLGQYADVQLGQYADVQFMLFNVSLITRN